MASNLKHYATARGAESYFGSWQNKIKITLGTTLIVQTTLAQKILHCAGMGNRLLGWIHFLLFCEAGEICAFFLPFKTFNDDVIRFLFTLVGTLNQLQIKYTLTFWREVNLNSHLWNETQAPAWSICWLKYHKHIIFCWKCWKSSSFFHLNFMMSLIYFLFLSHLTLLQQCIS